MHYISTRGNYPPVESANAINVGMVPSGGLFVPEKIPSLDLSLIVGKSYQDTARLILEPLLTDFTKSEIDECVANAYNSHNFDTETIVDLVSLDNNTSVLELWHGPTAAFKDMALQIMPHFLKVAKAKTGETSHTVILVATSGDTGKAALEGFKDCDGISIIVFYPHEGVSEIQRLQMATTEGENTTVVAVRGNFDDCQTGVKELFSDNALRDEITKNGFVFSSANSINWGRLCPQIVYYVRAYAMLVEKGSIRLGDKINFSVPTGNFGNILAGYYARCMGLPIDKLICASNKNNVLTDFFKDGVYDRNREFHRTMSPSMDILISSNLERFLFEVTGHNATKVNQWYTELAQNGRFEIDRATKDIIDSIIVPGWVDEPRVLETIRAEFKNSGYVLDTHTAVAAAVSSTANNGLHTVVTSTASPFKFSSDVLCGMIGEKVDDEFCSLERVAQLSGMKIHAGVDGLREKTIRHNSVIDIADMRNTVLDILGKITE